MDEVKTEFLKSEPFYGFDISTAYFLYGLMENSSRKTVPEENYPPALILTLILNQTLTLTGGDFPRGQFSGHHGKQRLDSFHNELYNFHLNLSFTRETSTEIVNFVDLNVRIKNSATYCRPLC